MDRRRERGEPRSLRVSAEKTAGLREKEVHPAVVVLGRDAVLEHTVPAQPNSEAGKAGQPAVVVSAAEAQAEAAAVIAHGGDQRQVDVRPGEKGASAGGSRIPKDAGTRGGPAHTAAPPSAYRAASGADPPACPGR